MPREIPEPPAKCDVPERECTVANFVRDMGEAIDRIDQKLERIHVLLFGNGKPETSLTWRVSHTEDALALISRILWGLVVCIGGLVATRLPEIIRVLLGL